MLRCTIELVPMGDESRKEVIGLIEIANDGTGTQYIGNYGVSLKKTPPFKGALKTNWRFAEFENEIELQSVIKGFSRIQRGVYDLLYKALVACGIDKR